MAVRVCIFGAGAIGGLLAAKLAATSATVSAIARGPTLTAIRENGIRLDSAGKRTVARVNATDDPQDLGVQDVVFLTVKGPGLTDVAARISPLLGPETVVVTAMNGVPWWFFDGYGGPLEGMRLASIDPGGEVASSIPTRHVLGCVVRTGASCPEPGVVRHTAGNNFIVGEPDGRDTPRLRLVAGLLRTAGLDVTVSPTIRKDIWYKLWGNIVLNPISAFTGATVDRIFADPLVRRFAAACMLETNAVGSAFGCPIDQTPDERMGLTSKMGAIKTSMLQDAEAGKPLEIDGILTVVTEIARRAKVPTPNLDALLGLVRMFAQTHGIYTPTQRASSPPKPLS